jgi:hypothetical protein
MQHIIACYTPLCFVVGMIPPITSNISGNHGQAVTAALDTLGVGRLRARGRCLTFVRSQSRYWSRTLNRNKIVCTHRARSHV